MPFGITADIPPTVGPTLPVPLQVHSVPGGHLLVGTGALHSPEPASSRTCAGHETTGTASVLRP